MRWDASVPSVYPNALLVFSHSSSIERVDSIFSPLLVLNSIIRISPVLFAQYTIHLHTIYSLLHTVLSVQLNHTKLSNLNNICSNY